jgi:leucyl-tRNA synthetase
MEVDVGGVGKDNHKAPRHHVITQELLCNKEKAWWGGQKARKFILSYRLAEWPNREQRFWGCQLRITPGESRGLSERWN